MTNPNACFIIPRMATTRKTRTTRSKSPVPPTIEPEITQPAIVEDDFITFKRSHFFAAVSVLTFFAGLSLGYVIWGTSVLSSLGVNPSSAEQAQGAVSEAPVATQAPKYIRYDIPVEGFYALGPKDASITLVEFSDFQCPFCKRWHDEVFEPLLAAYPGQIRLVYRNLPLTTIHPDAMSAAEAAMCAGEQDAFWPFHEKLFSSSTLGMDVYLQYGQQLNLDMTKFETCVTGNKYQADIQKDSEFAIDLGISSTPTFFVNGLAIVGAQPLDVFKQIIDKELAGEIP